METIISASISAASAIIVCVISQSRLVSLIEYRLEQLEKKQDKYNGVIERTYELEKKEEVLEAELEATNKEVKRLGHFHE